MAAPIRILCVDDDADTLKVVQMSLALSADIAFETASSGAEAVEKASEFKPDAFLLDVLMPGRSGIQLLHDLRESPAWRRTPVIFLTVRCGEEDLRDYSDLGVLGVIPKPFASGDLASRVLDLLGRGQSPDSGKNPER